MENKDPIPEAEAVNTPRRRSFAERFSFMDRWQADRQPNMFESDDDDDEEETREESPAAKRYQRVINLGKSVLGIGEPAKKPAEAKFGKSESLMADLFGDDEAESAPPDAEPPLEDELFTLPHAETTSEPLIEAPVYEAVEVPVPVATVEAPAPVPPAETTEPIVAEVPEAAIATPLPSIEGAARPLETTSSSTVGTPTVETYVRPERVVEHHTNSAGVAAVAIGLGLEHIGRNRKINKQEVRTDKKLEKLREEAKQHAEDNKQELERLIRFNSEATATLRIRQEQQERQQKEQKRIIEAPRPMAKPVEKIVPTPEKRREISYNRPATREVPVAARLERPVERAFEQQAEMSKTPDKLQTVETTAAPAEQLLERRHEVKDDDAYAAAQASSVGTILAQQVSTKPSSASPQDNPAPARLTDKQLKRLNPEMYTQAMTMGLTGAAVIIIFGLLIYFFAR